MIDNLYSGRILALAANIQRIGRLSAPDATAEKSSKVCGSRVVVDLVLSENRVVDFAQEVQACALGQAAAAVLGANIIGASVEEIEAGRNALKGLLTGGGVAPGGRFADLAILEPVRDFPARHASTLLAFEATAEAARVAVTTKTRRAG